MKEGTRPMKNGILRILQLEDDAHDVELLAGWLDDEGFQCEIRNVQTAAAFEAALGGNETDLIISDYALPTFDGLKALGMARERLPDVPFILFSGTIGEELAIDCRSLCRDRPGPNRRNGLVIHALQDRAIRCRCGFSRKANRCRYGGGKFGNR